MSRSADSRRVVRSAARWAAAGTVCLTLSLGTSACLPRSSSVLGGGTGAVDWSAVNEAVVPAVVRIKVTTCDAIGYGSGFSLDATTIVSNEHVVEGSTRLEVDAPWYLGASPGAQTTVDGADVAVIASPQPSDAVLPLAAQDPVPGDRIEVLGYPGGGDLTITTGRVIEIADGQRHGVSGPVIYSDARVRPGNSGGPMINADGEVVGLVMAIDLREGDGMAIPVSVLRQSLAAPRSPVATDCDSE